MHDGAHRRPVRWAVLAGAVAQIVAAPSHRWMPALGLVDEAISVGDRSDALSTPVTPAGYAFSIWGLIFLLAILYALWQLASADRRAAAAAPWVALAFWGCAAWQVIVPALGLTWGAQILLGAVALSAIAAARQLNRPAPAGRPGWLVSAPLALLAGWAVAAFCVGLATTLVANGLIAREAFAGGPVVATLVLAGGLAVGALWAVRGHPLTLAAVIWALVAIELGNAGGASWGGLERAVLWLAGLAALAATFLAWRAPRR